jgi:uncharacterized protein YbjT (DUF2867 family)
VVWHTPGDDDRAERDGSLIILVTGAGGNVGSKVLEELRAGGHSARGAYHSPLVAQEGARRGEDTAVVDLADATTLGPALDGVDSVFLLGAMGPEQTRNELNMVHAALHSGVRRIVKLSVWRADEQLTPIACMHRPVEKALESLGVEWTFLRPNFYMQNFARQMAVRIKDDGVIAQPSSTAAISFIDARDIARVAAQVLTSDGHAGQIYDLTGPRALTYDDAAEVFSGVLDRPVRFVGLSDEEAWAGMLQGGLSESYADALIAVTRAYRNGGAEIVSPAVRELTGRDPIDLQQFVRDHRHVFL